MRSVKIKKQIFGKRGVFSFEALNCTETKLQKDFRSIETSISPGIRMRVGALKK